jgi:hypothetical protein
VKTAIIFVVTAASLTQTPLVAQAPPKGADLCAKKTHVSISYCKILSNEFYVNQRFKSHTYGPAEVLNNPLTQPILFVSANFKTSYLKVVQSAVKTQIQADANSLAQAISSKADVSQPGAGATSAGTTSLVSKPTTTDLISLASESGAFTDTVNGTTLTAQVNVNGLRRYISNQNFSTLDPHVVDVLQHLTIAATFNVAQSGSNNASSSGAATSSTPSSILNVVLPSNNLTFTSVGANWEIYRPYTPTSKGFNQAWMKAIQTYLTSNKVDLLASFTSDFNRIDPPAVDLGVDPDIVAARVIWNQAAIDNETSGNFSKFLDAYEVFVAAVVKKVSANDSTFDQDIVDVYKDIGDIQSVRNTILDNARGSLATLSYTYSTPPGKPATHDATAVVAYVWSQKDAGAQLTANFGGSWFATVPPGAAYGRLKDYQFSGEFDQPLPPHKGPANASTQLPKATLSLAGYGQYQYAANVLNVTVTNLAPGTNISVPANSQIFTSTPGWLGVAQTKLTFNIGKGASIPIAVKWSNKTDLLNTGDWTGQFGFSYDLSALSSILAAK